jgi:hypothetical protein
MEYLSIQNFKYGLDARRSAMTSQPGALVRLENAHINAGGEIEKRKAFYRSPNLFPDNTFGLEVTEDGLVTFGSDAAPNAALPSGVSYIRLISPSLYAPNTDNPDDMLGVVYSCNFNGKSFVLAEFASGVWAYYDGTLVPSSRAGRVLQGVPETTGDGETLTQLSQSLADQVNALDGWVAIANDGQAGKTTVKSPPGLYFSVIPSNDSISGLLGVVFVDKDGGAVSAVSAVASFKVWNIGGGADTFALSAFKDIPGADPIDLTFAPVVGTVDANTTASAIVAAVNAYTALTGYFATVNADSVFIYAPLTFGAVTFDLTVTTTGTATTAVTAVLPGALQANANPTYVNTKKFTFGSSYVYSPPSTTTAIGGTGPYTYLWVECNPDGTTPVALGTGIEIVNDALATTTFRKFLLPHTFAVGYFKCTVTDSLAATDDTEVVFVFLGLNLS